MAGHVGRMEEGRSAFKILTGKPTGKRPSMTLFFHLLHRGFKSQEETSTTNKTCRISRKNDERPIGTNATN